MANLVRTGDRLRRRDRAARIIQDPATGRTASQRPAWQRATTTIRPFNNVCRTCHTRGEGDNRLGPSLHKIIGRKAGSLPNYNYSSAMKGADLVWDRATLDRFISNPDQVIPGNNMKPYSGLTSAEERAKIVAFLEANDGD